MNILVCEDLGIAEVIVDRLRSLAKSRDMALETSVTESIDEARETLLRHDVLVIDVSETKGRELAVEALQNHMSVLATITGLALYNDPIIPSDVLHVIEKPDFPLKAFDFAIDIFYDRWQMGDSSDILSLSE